VTITVYTDGACLGNPGPGGWAWAVPGSAYASGAAANTTNQRMELTAVLEAIGTLSGPLLVVSDSQYVVNCFRDRWYAKWETNGWKNSKREPVENPDLWRHLLAAFRTHGQVEFQWVKGHSGDEGNDLVDRLAVEAAESQVGRSGDTPPKSVRLTPDEPFRDRGSSANPSRSFPARFAGVCATCSTRFAEGTPIVRNKVGKYVHAGGCPRR
jgi:ribonuclease HI